jgi:hypothetical protein
MWLQNCLARGRRKPHLARLRAHPCRTKAAHPFPAIIGSLMERSDVPYFLVGAAVLAQRRTEAAAGVASRVTEVALAPAALVWRSAPARPLRQRASDMSAALIQDGHGTATRSVGRSRVALQRLGVEVSRSGVVEEVVDRLLEAGVVDRVVTVILNHPATVRMVDGVLDDPAVDRLVTRILGSPMVENLTASILASDEMQMVMEHIMRSPELRAALAQQTAGLAGDMAVSVRSRTVVADDVAERVARGLLRRRQRPRIQ